MKENMKNYVGDNFFISLGLTLLSYLPSVGNVNRISYFVPFITKISDLLSKRLAGDFVCKKTLTDLKISEDVANIICKILQYIIHYYIVFTTINLTYMYFLSPATTSSFYLEYLNNIKDLSKKLLTEFADCTNKAVTELLKEGTFAEIPLAKKVYEDLKKINSEDFANLIDATNNIAISLAINMGILGYANNVKTYVTGILNYTTGQFSNLGYLTQKVNEVKDWLVGSGNAKIIIENQQEFFTKIIDIKNKTSDALVLKQYNDIFKLPEMSTFLSAKTEIETKNEINKMLNVFTDLFKPTEGWLSLNRNKISPAFFEKNDLLTRNLLEGTQSLIQSLQTSKLDTLKALGSTTTMNETCIKNIATELYKFHTNVEANAKIHDKNIGYKSDLFRWMPRIYLAQIFGNTISTDGTLSQTLPNPSTLIESSYNIATVFVFLYAILFFIIKIILIITRLIKRR
jgi:hypothetical protein